MHLQMGHQDGVKGIRHMEVCLLRFGLMDVYDSIYFYYLLLCIIYIFIA